MKKITYKWSLFLAFSISIIAGVIFYILLSKPFGFLFNTGFYLLTGGLVLGFLMLGILSFKSPKWWLKFIGIIPGLLSLLILVVTIAVSIDVRILYFTGIPPNPTKAEWVKDVHFLADQMQKKYPNFNSKVSDELVNETVKDIENKIQQLSESDIVMELFRLNTLPNDAHTIPFIFFPCFDLHDFPLKFFKFSDGWYIIDAARAYSHLVGTKILKIGSTSIDDLFKKFIPYLSAENEYAQLERFTYIGLMPEWLKSQGVIDNLKNAQFTLENKNGDQVVETIDAVRFINKFYWSFMRSVDNRTSPAIINPRKDSYWFEHLEKSKTIYFQFNEVQNQKGKETIAQFTKRLAEFVNTNEFNRFVVDLRNNMGGDDSYLKPLVELLRDNPKINQRNKLFVLTGRHTFSSAVLFAYKLKLQTKAIFIGEPTAQGPVFCGNPTQIKLPNSGLVFTVATTSTARTQAIWPFKTENAINPDTLVSYSFDDFKTGRDPVMELALNYKIDEPTSEAISEMILDSYTGRYLLDSYHILQVDRNDSNLSFFIDDFSDYNLFRVQSDLYAKSEFEFATDLKNVNISFPKDSEGGISSLILNWDGQISKLKRAPKDYTTALELLSQNRIDEAVCQIEINKEQYQSLSFVEDVLNLAGYQYLNQEKFDDAIKVFSLNVNLFPGSWNAYDSLGEAYMKAGKKELAIENYKKSLELNPKNETAQRIIES
jgi:hypothetical protein